MFRRCSSFVRINKFGVCVKLILFVVVCVLYVDKCVFSVVLLMFLVCIFLFVIFCASVLAVCTMFCRSS